MSTTSQGVFINLPVADLSAAMAFFRALGFDFDARFTDATAAALVLGERQHVMLLTHPKFAGFAPNAVGDAHRATQVLIALQLDSRAAVDAMVERAVAAGGSTFRAPEDHGFMYGHAFRDLDGHVFEPFVMDLAAFERLQGVAS